MVGIMARAGFWRRTLTPTLSPLRGARGKEVRNTPGRRAGRSYLGRRPAICVGGKVAVMVKVGLFARLQAKPGKEAEVAKLLEGALALAREERETVVWYALRFGPSTFGIFDAFETEQGREAHLNGRIAAALMAKAPELLAEPPKIEKVDLLASKT